LSPEPANARVASGIQFGMALTRKLGVIMRMKLYYPSRRQPSAAFALLVDALRYRR
jgi:hypothetical protein